MAQRPGRRPGLRPDGPKIRQIRIDLGLTAVQVGDRIGFSPGMVRHAERSGPIGDVFASRLAKVLGVQVKDIATPPEAEAALDAKTGPAAGTAGPGRELPQS